jgi:glycosyltransferase involved in cell wall biosynthesis
MSRLATNSSVERNTVRAVSWGDGRPRVLHLINSFDTGGTERQAVELLNRLDESRFDVRLAALRWRGPLLDQIASRFPSAPEFPLTSFYNANALRQLLRLRRFLIEQRIDILHAHDFYAGVLGVAAARLSGVRVVAAQRHLRLSDRRVHELGTRFIHKLAHRLLVNSEAIRDHILDEGRVEPEKIVVIRNGLSFGGYLRDMRARERRALCAELRLNAEEKDLVIIGSVARLQPVKGHRYLIEAMTQVAASHPNAHLALVGDGDLRDEILKQAAELGIAARVHLLGDRDDASRIVAAFDVAALASLHEGMPNAVMEAMAAGVPVIATAVGGTKELIKDFDTGFLVRPASAEALADCIEFVLSHREESELMALRGRRFLMEQFDVRRMVRSVEELYEEMLAS